MVELRPGDVFLFLGSMIAHNVTGIQSGERSSVDMFCHSNVFQYLATTAFGDLAVQGSSRKSEVRRRLIRFLRSRTQEEEGGDRQDR